MTAIASLSQRWESDASSNSDSSSNQLTAQAIDKEIHWKNKRVAKTLCNNKDFTYLKSYLTGAAARAVV